MIDVFNKLSDDIIIINTYGEILFINNKLLSKLSYDKSELLGKSSMNLLKDNVTYNKILNYKIDKSLEEFPFNIYSKTNEALKYNGILSLENYNGKEVIFIICNEVNEELYTKEDLENFINNIPFMCVLKDIKGKYLFANKSFFQGTEEKKENIIGKYDKDIFNDETTKKTLLEEHHVIITKENLITEKYVEKVNGFKRWFKIHKIPIINNTEEVKYVGSISYDVTLRKNIETQLDYRFEQSLSLNNDDINESYNRLDYIQNMLVKNLNADGFNIWICHENNTKVVSQFSHGISYDIMGQKSNVEFDSREFTKHILNTDFEGIKSISAIKDSLIKDLYEKHGVKYRGLYKISFNNKVIGLLSITYKDIEPDYSQEDYLKKMCNKIGVIVKNYSLYLQLKKEFNKRMQIEKELEEFLNTATDILAIIDEEGNFVKINNDATNLLGWSKEELLSTKWQSVIYSEDLKASIDSVEKSKKCPGVVKHYINRITSKSGELIWLHWSYKYLEENNSFMCTAKNITEEKKLEVQKAIYEKSLQLESIKSEFFANLSHEFRTPLNIILATMQLIDRGIENKDIINISEFNLKRYVSSIKQNSYRLLRLVNNLIDMSKLDTGYYRINLENNNIVSIIEDITMSVVQLIDDKDISLIFDTEVEEKIIACDPDKIERIMLNLLSNAIKYTSCKGQIDVTLSIHNDNILVSVKDNGIGIPKENLETIFDRFVQVDNTLTRKCEGSGIGLSLVKSLVELHGGKIMVKSEEDEGAEFIFQIPIKTIESHNEIKISENTISSKIEKCNIEFSDIYY